MLRRIVRDAQFRGYPASKTIGMWPSVRAGEEVNIFPFNQEADVFFNSQCLYELAVLKKCGIMKRQMCLKFANFPSRYILLVV